jgi:hypothetical protein
VAICLSMTLTRRSRPLVDWASGRSLRHRTFRTVADGELVSVLGDYAYRVAFAWLVLSVSGSHSNAR